MSNDKAERGREILRQLCGNDDAVASFPEPFRQHTLEHLFGDVWTDDDLPLVERSLVTCTILTALGREKEQQFHFAAAKRLGIPRAKMLAMITHVAHYAGWPCAVGAVRTMNEVWPETE